jgi:ABC-2 type transport system ATP-binding protein
MFSAKHKSVREPYDGSAVIRTSGLTKAFGGRAVVDGLGFDVPAGVVCGFVGPNGAGKTTTIRMLLGLVRPTSGSGEVLGQPLEQPDRFLPRVGAMIEGPAFTAGLSGTDNLRALARAGGVPLRRVDEVLDRVGLGARGADRYRSYSLGMKQRLGIAAALLPEPDLLVLDEPTNGLDPAGILQIRDLIAEFRADGMTVFVSSHLLSELEQVADHLVMIRAGRLVFQGPLQELVAQHPPTITLRPERQGDVRLVESIVGSAGLTASAEDLDVLVQLPPSTTAEESFARAADLNRRAHEADVVLARLDVQQPSLEEAFLTMAGADSGDVR